MARRLTIALTLLALAAAGAGCGGDDDETTTAADPAAEAAADGDAQAAARTAQTALETYAVDNNGSYAGADVAGIGEIEPTLADADLTVTTDATTYTVEVTSTTGTRFSIARTEDGAVELTCEPTGTESCSQDGSWN